MQRSERDGANQNQSESNSPQSRSSVHDNGYFVQKNVSNALPMMVSIHVRTIASIGTQILPESSHTPDRNVSMTSRMAKNSSSSYRENDGRASCPIP
jgi:hypothetical protein